MGHGKALPYSRIPVNSYRSSSCGKCHGDTASGRNLRKCESEWMKVWWKWDIYTLKLSFQEIEEEMVPLWRGAWLSPLNHEVTGDLMSPARGMRDEIVLPWFPFMCVCVCIYFNFHMFCCLSVCGGAGSSLLHRLFSSCSQRGCCPGAVWALRSGSSLGHGLGSCAARLRCSEAGGSSGTRDWACLPCLGRWTLGLWATKEGLLWSSCQKCTTLIWSQTSNKAKPKDVLHSNQPVLLKGIEVTEDREVLKLCPGVKETKKTPQLSAMWLWIGSESGKRRARKSD